MVASEVSSVPAGKDILKRAQELENRGLVCHVLLENLEKLFVSHVKASPLLFSFPFPGPQLNSKATPLPVSPLVFQPVKIPDLPLYL